MAPGSKWYRDWRKVLAVVGIGGVAVVGGSAARNAVVQPADVVKNAKSQMDLIFPQPGKLDFYVKLFGEARPEVVITDAIAQDRNLHPFSVVASVLASGARNDAELDAEIARQQIKAHVEPERAKAYVEVLKAVRGFGLAEYLQSDAPSMRRLRNRVKISSWFHKQGMVYPAEWRTKRLPGEPRPAPEDERSTPGLLRTRARPLPPRLPTRSVAYAPRRGGRHA